MTDVDHDIGAARALETEAIGPPGQRQFRIRVTTDQATASLWLEKEQVQAVATAIEQVLAQNRRGGTRRPAPPPLGPFPDEATHDFRVSRLALGYEEGPDRLSIYVTDADSPHQERATLRASFTREIARRFSTQAEATVQAGRPLCPLCKQPLEIGGHFCPPANGHSDDSQAWLDLMEF